MPRCSLVLKLAVVISLPTLALAADKDEPRRPRVLLIGDSISIGYTPSTVKLLEGQAKVTHHAGNAQDTRNGLKQLPTWLKEGPFEVIHFNWGLWDLVDGGKAVPIDEYEKNLRALVKQLKATNAKLIWASTTPVPEMNARKRRDADVVAYNAVAKKVMDENQIPIDDLYALIKPQAAKVQIANDVHFSKEGSQELAKQVAQSIEKALAGPLDAQIGKLLKDKGVTLTETKGVVTAATVKDGGKLTDADFGQLGRLAHLKSLDVNLGLNDARLALLKDLSALENLQTNGAQITDDGLKPLAQLKSLRNLKFFHPGRSFTGAGLAHLAGLPQLQQLTVAGSLAFNDEGMAAVAKLTQLQEFRTWHAGATQEGIKKLKALRHLKCLNLGQRLTYQPPACPTDDTIAILAELKSLEVLQLGESRLTFTALQQLKQLPALKKLTLDGIDVPKADVSRLQQELPKVKIEWTEPNETYQKRIRALFGAK